MSLFSKHSILFSVLTIMMNTIVAQNFDQYPVYTNADLGLHYTPKKSTFRIWAPSASAIQLRFYKEALDGEVVDEVKMKKGKNGTWIHNAKGNMIGKYYSFQAKVDGEWNKEVPDPYTKAVGTNGQRAQVIDMAKTNPKGWENDTKPSLKNYTDIVLWEVHVRDLSTHKNSGIKNKGKFLGFTEEGTKNKEGLATGLDHIKELGVTHVHLLPSYDFGSVDESKLDKKQFNWGYDPMNYNVPEGSYSTNPADGATRIKEFKQLVQSLHKNDLRVVMDVVYNHTFTTEGMCFEELVPGYYFRQNEKGELSNASGCGNETASERAMVKKYFVESVCYWAKEYHIDGFRFDLMGIHDKDLMNEIRNEIDKIDPSIFIYGEGWTAGSSPLPDEQRCLKANTYQLNRIAAFSDDARDALRGSVFNHEEQGFVSGNLDRMESIKFGIVAATAHPQVDMNKVNYSNTPWAGEPFQCINYASCHDNHTLWDRLVGNTPNASEEELIAMHKLSQTIVLTSQGVPFLHAGSELLRTKGGNENSYKSPDSVNRIDWDRKTKYQDVFEYYKNLIALRKAHPAFRMISNEMIQQHLQFIDNLPQGIVGYKINNNANGDKWKTILVLLNGSRDAKNIQLPDNKWTLVLTPEIINQKGIVTLNGNSSIQIGGTSAMIFVEK